MAKPLNLDEAVQHFAANRAAEAEALCRQIVRTHPRNSAALHLLGLAVHRQGQPAEALAYLRKAVAAKPDYPEAWSNLGAVLVEMQQRDEAVAAFGRAVALNPGLFEIHVRMGSLLLSLNRPQEAVTAYRAAILLRPDSAEQYFNLALALQAQAQLDLAEEAFQTALRLNPALADPHCGLGNLRLLQGRFQEAASCFRAALALRPDFPQAQSNLGQALKDLGDLTEAEAVLRASLQHWPDQATAQSALGTVLKEQGRYTEAVGVFRRALALTPTLPEARFNLGVTLLTLGDFTPGWQAYEARWQTREFAAGPVFVQPHWAGEPLEGRTILLHSEQGAGDAIQFVRYVEAVVNRGGRVLLSIPASLIALFEAIPGVAEVNRHGDLLPRFDVHCPLLSLPRVLGTTQASLPDRVPYLSVPMVARSRSQAWIGAETPGLKVGLVWAGNPQHQNDRNRSIPFSTLAPLFELAGVRWFSLQLGAHAADLVQAPAGRILDLSPHLQDYVDTAAVLEQLDLILSVDTSVAHLAGALARPTWILLPCVPDWRWMLGRNDSPWYPTARLFRQTRPGDWEKVVAEVQQALHERAPARTRSGRCPEPPSF